MDKFSNLINQNFKISLIFLFLGIFFGIVYSINLLGFSINSNTLLPSNVRSLHISLMLYGFIPLMLSYLPFLLINKDGIKSDKGLRYLGLYSIFWYIFLVFMISSLVLGNTRDLAFYDFPYELNFILALSGVFYALALYEYIKLYKVKPLWIKVSLAIVIIAPFCLLILMNPTIGQVESTISGPHGDNTLGMSFALIPIYYLIIKLLHKGNFNARWHIFWIIPFVFYILSVLYRSFVASLTYEQEWFLQYLTFLYIPLLYRWFQDAHISKTPKYVLLISILAFLFVDIEGNILFIPEFRWLFHRNDLIVAHAHVAMGISILFMTFAILANHINSLKDIKFYKYYLFGILGIFLVLSISGFVQAGVIKGDIEILWSLRTLFGIVVFISFFKLIKLDLKLNSLQKYNLLGALSDGSTGIILIFLGSYLYPLLGFKFTNSYEYIVFIFVFTTGIIHYFAFISKKSQYEFTLLTALIRIFVSSMFFALYLNGSLSYEALFITVFDLSFSVLFFIIFYKKELSCFQKLL